MKVETEYTKEIKGITIKLTKDEACHLKSAIAYTLPAYASASTYASPRDLAMDNLYDEIEKGLMV